MRKPLIRGMPRTVPSLEVNKRGNNSSSSDLPEVRRPSKRNDIYEFGKGG
jgi:hypothetical protein